MVDPRYAIVDDSLKVIGVVIWNGVSEHPYGDVDLRGPVPENATLQELLGKKVEGHGPFAFATDGGLYTPSESLVPGMRVLVKNQTNVPDHLAVVGEPVEPHAFLGDGETIPPEPVAWEDLPMEEADYVHWERQQAVAAEDAPALIESADSMKFFEFKAKAQRILGYDCPAKKAEIIAELRKVTGDGW